MREFDKNRYAACKHVSECLLQSMRFKPVEKEQVTLSVLTELLYSRKVVLNGQRAGVL